MPPPGGGGWGAGFSRRAALAPYLSGLPAARFEKGGAARRVEGGSRASRPSRGSLTPRRGQSDGTQPGAGPRGRAVGSVRGREARGSSSGAQSCVSVLGSARDGASVLKERIRIKGASPPGADSRPCRPRPPVWSDNRAAEEAVNPHPSRRSHSVGISQSLGP